ncbi:MAG: DUF5107 domain-containing protein [Acidobacteria bacterium]|nr:DUF5107 domain-containing protein [Acidobacteriota bacterium]
MIARCSHVLAVAALLIGAASPHRADTLVAQETERLPAVRVWEDDVVIPTYALGADDINPHFRETSDSIIYPYTKQDAFTSERVDRTYRAIFLENEYLRVMCLPEIGGRIQSVFDKTTGEEMFYRNRVIRPGHIALRGAWVSGGIEWNRGPDGHTVTSFSPVDVLPVQNPDGSAALLIGNTEMNFRTGWQVTLTLHPQRKVLDERIRIFNPTDGIHTYYFWNNTAFPNRPGTRFIYPMTLGSDHNGTSFFSWPEHEGRDLTYLRNYPEPTSVFGYQVAFDFFGAYDVDRDFGIVQVADHHELPGKKAWTWGEADAGLVAQSVLTDDDGPYIEVQSGPLPTQADFGLLVPGHEISWQEFWYPVNGLGDGFEYATEEVAIQRRGTATGVEFRFAGTRQRRDVDLTIERQDGRTERRRLALSPATVETIEVDTTNSAVDPGSMRMRLRLTSSEGSVLAEYSSPLEIPERTAPTLDETSPTTPEERYWAADLLGRQGDRAGAIRGFEAILADDPGHVGSLESLGAMALEAGEFEAARGLLERATKQSEYRGLTWYLLGVARLRLGDFDGARTAAALASQRADSVALGHSLRGRIEAQSGNHAAALDSFTAGLTAGGGDWTRLFDFVMLAAYGAGEDEQARFLSRQAVTSGTLRLVPHVIDSLARGEPATELAQRARAWIGEPEFTFIETSLAFAEVGLYRDAAALLEASLWAVVAPADRRPLPAYYMAYFHELRGDTVEASHWLDQAQSVGGDYVFPSRPEGIAVLQYAVEQRPGDAKAWLYLGNLYAGLGRHPDAREAWTQAANLDPQLSVAARNLGIDAWKLAGDLDSATEWFQRAIAARPMDQTLYRDLGRVLSERSLAENAASLLESVPVAPNVRRADVTLDLARAYVELERYDDAVALLDATTFTQREGDTGTREVFYTARIERGIRRFEDFDHGGALEDFEAALTYPTNLNVGRPYRPREARAHYWLGLALDALGRIEQANEAWAACAAGEPLDEEQQEYSSLCAERVGR